MYGAARSAENVGYLTKWYKIVCRDYQRYVYLWKLMEMHKTHIALGLSGCYPQMQRNCMPLLQDGYLGTFHCSRADCTHSWSSRTSRQACRCLHQGWNISIVERYDIGSEMGAM